MNDQIIKNEEDQEEAIKIIDTTEKVEIDNEEPSPKKPNKSGKELLHYIILIAVAFGLAQIIHRYVFTPVTVDGESMIETLHDKDYLFLLRLGSIHRFDVVVFDVPEEGDAYIKRVIGLPGDDVEVSNNTLYINGKKYDEPYLDKRKNELGNPSNFTSNFTLEEVCHITNVNCTSEGKVEIPKGYYLVLGDNRPWSKDSRMIGLVSKDKLIGKALYILYPLNRLGKIE